jgi:hypothetical protein
MSEVKRYLDNLPESPEPFGWKEFVGDAYVAGYEAAMKDGMEQLNEQMKRLYQLMLNFYEAVG